jgi:ferredoxin
VVLREEVEDSEHGRLDESVRSCPVAALKLHQPDPAARLR